MKLFEFILNKSDIEFLETNIKNDSVIANLHAAKATGAIIVKGKYTTNKYDVILSAEAISSILDELGDLLSSSGIDGNYAPKALRQKIENLIDIFSASDE